MEALLANGRFDAGKVLLKALTDFKQLRAQLEHGAREEDVRSSVHYAIDQAESGLSKQAKVIVRKVQEEQLGDGEAVRGSRRPCPGPGDSRRAQAASRPGQGLLARVRGTEAAVKLQREAAAGRLAYVQRLIHEPRSEKARSYVKDVFGVDTPSKALPEELKEEDTEACAGAVMRGSTVKPSLIIPKRVREDPAEPAPLRMLDLEVRKGLLHLVNVGLMPFYADLTPTLIGEAGVVKAEAAALYPHHRQFDRPVTRQALESYLEKAGVWQLDVLTPMEDAAGRNKPAASARRMADGSGKARLQGTAVADERSGSTVMWQQSLEEVSGPRPDPEIYIQNGVTLDTTHSFSVFHRKYKDVWLPVAHLLLQMEAILTEYNVPIAIVDGKAVAALSAYTTAVGQVATTEDLLSCIYNIQQVAAILRIPGRRFQAPDGEEVAATLIQRHARGFLARQWYNANNSKAQAARRIQCAWRVARAREEVQGMIAAARQKRDRQFAALQEQLRQAWPSLHEQHHVIIHLPTATLPGSPPSGGDAAEHSRHARVAQAQEAAQLARICDIADPLIDVLYITPAALPDDVEGYWQKLLEVGGVEEPSTRYRALHPENGARLPPRMSLTAKLLSSPRTMQHIRNYLQGRPAYIVPGVISDAEVDLAVALGVPLLGPHPVTMRALAKKSSARMLLASAMVNLPPGVCMPPAVEQPKQEAGKKEALREWAAARSSSPDASGRANPLRRPRIRRDEGLIGTLAKLMTAKPGVLRWLIKLDNAENAQGHAYVDRDAIPGLAPELDRLNQEGFEGLALRDLKEAVTTEVRALLLQHLPKKLVIASQAAFPGYRTYVEALRRQGAVVEACPNRLSGSPSANIFVEPTGRVSLLSSQEQIFCPAYRAVGCSFPQSSLPHAALADATLAVAQACFQAGVWGHVSIDFVTLRDHGNLRLWAVDLNFRYSASLAAFQLFDFLSGGVFETRSGSYTVSQQDDAFEEASPPVNLSPTENTERIASKHLDSVESGNPGAGADGAASAPDHLNDAKPGLDRASSITRAGRESLAWLKAEQIKAKKSAQERIRAGTNASAQSSIESAPTNAHAPQRRYFVACHYLYHPAILHMKHSRFFRQCRENGFCFNVRDRMGMAFNLMGGAGGGSMGLLCASSSLLDAFEGMAACLDFLGEQLQNGGQQHGQHLPTAEQGPKPDRILQLPLRSASTVMSYLADKLRLQ